MAGITSIVAKTERLLVNQWNQSIAQSALASYRVAMGKQINAPSDDPSVFVALAGLQSQLNTVNQTMRNVTAASSVVTQTQTAMTQIRTQLATIRTELLKDENHTLTSAQRAASQQVIDQAVAQIDTLAGTESAGRKTLDGSADFQISGQNYSQVRDLQVYTTSVAEPIVAAKKAELTYTGTNRYATSDASIQVAGNSGSTIIAISEDDTLESIARSVNAVSLATGVTASVDDNTLKFDSVGASAGAFARVTVLSGSFETSGGDLSGTAYGVTQVMGATPAISGRVAAAATQGSLLYAGSGGHTTAAATFTLSGEAGSASITVANVEDLTSVAGKINMVSHKTGVTATVDGDSLQLASVDYGTDANVAVSVASGTFAVTGGHGDGTANGTNAVAEINGKTYAGSTLAQAATLRHREKTSSIANNAQIKITGNLGSTTLTINKGSHTNDTLASLASSINAATGTTGVLARVDQNDLVLESTTQGASASITLETLGGTFDTVSNETHATGVNATTSQYDIQGNTFNINENGFHYTLSFANGFSGDFSTMQVVGNPMSFNLTGATGAASQLPIASMMSNELGGVSGTLSQIVSGGSYAGLGDNTSQAIRIVDEAIGCYEAARGAVDGYYTAAVTSSSNLLTALQDDLDTSIQQTDGFNEAREEERVSYYNQLASNSLSGLALLNMQQQIMVDLIKSLAGLSS
jgi:flagellin